MSDISRLIADVKEQVLYLRELGGDAVEFDPELIDLTKSISRVPKSVSPVVLPAVTPVVESAPRRPHQKESRLSSLPSLSKRAPVEPDRSISISMPASTLPASPGNVKELINIE